MFPDLLDVLPCVFCPSDKGQPPFVLSWETSGFCAGVWCGGSVGSCPAVGPTAAGSFRKVFDVQRKVTYRNLNSWYQELREFRPEIPCVVAANKIDGECLCCFQPRRIMT